MAQSAAPLGSYVENDKMEEMIEVAKRIATAGKGILASDERNAGMGSKLKLIGLENNFDNRRRFRELLYTTPGLNQYISGIIFNPETFNECKIGGNGQLFRDYVNNEGILVGIKVDNFVRPFPYKQNEVFTIGTDDLLERAAAYYKNGARFAKLRVVFRIQNGHISPSIISENVYLSAKYALLCQSAGLVPIVEPDLLMNGNHSAAVCKYWTGKILNRMYAVLNEYDVDLRATILKPNMILSGKETSAKGRSFKENAVNTIDVLSANVPVAVPGIMFLSGGMGEEEATMNLNEINKLFVKRIGRATIARPPWSISFSYGRALQHSAVLEWQGKDENVRKAQAEFLKRCKANSDAQLGNYTGWALRNSDVKLLKQRGYVIKISKTVWMMASLSSNATDTMEWNDVTDVVSSITSKMDLGQMIHAPDFNLHSAMSALEIGDGVLDAAMKERLLYMENVLNDETLITQIMNAQQNEHQLIGTLDELLKLLWSFFNGNSDQFSIYSSLYLYDEIRNHPKNTNNDILYLFIDVIKLCCGYAREIVTLSGISEDEDWSKNKHFELFHVENLTQLTTKLQTTLNDYKSAAKLSENSDSKQLENASQTAQYSKSEYAQAICYRFEFLSSLLNIMRAMYSLADMFKLDDDTVATQNNKNEANNVQNTNKKEEKQETEPPKIKGNKPQSQSKKHVKHSKSNKKQNISKHKQKGKGKKGGAKKQTKGKGKQKSKKHAQQQSQSQTQTQPNTNANEEKSGENERMYLIDRAPSSPCTLSMEVITQHKSSLLSFKPSASALLRIVNHLIETQAMGMDKPPGFDARIGNNKSVHAPRKQRIPAKLECFKSWKDWCKTLRFMCDLCNVSTFDGFLEFLDAFNRTDDRSEFPNVVLRSLLTVIIEQFAKYDTFLWSRKPLIHFLQKSFRDLCEWCRIFPNTNKQYLGDYYTFYSRVETAVRDVVRQKLLHITRQMDWTKRIIKNWQILETESPEIDRLTALSYLAGFDAKYHAQINQMEEYKAQPAAFSGWVIDQCCSSMIHYIFIHLSKHMQLYAAYEIEYVYYYLEYLFRNKTRIYEQSFRRFQKVDIEKLNEIINPHYAAMKARRKQKKQSKKSSNKQRQQQQKLLPPIDPNDKYIYVLSEAQRCLCLAIFEIIQCFYQINKENNSILKWHGLSDRLDVDEKESDLQHRVSRLGDESLRFAHRFNIFLHVDQPMAISYRQYRSIMYEYHQKNKLLTDKFKQLQAQLDQSSKSFGVLANAKAFDDIPSYQQEYIRTARKVAVMNKIFAAKLLKLVLSQKGNQLEINIKHSFDIHPFYAVFDFQQ